MAAKDSIYKTTKSIPAGKMEQDAFNEKAKAKKTMDVLVIPDLMIPDASAAGVKVGKGNLCRVEGTSGGYLSFGASAAMAAPLAADAAGTIKTPAGFFFIVASDEFVRTSAAMRIEVVTE